jgi:hypothetical protein
VRSDGGDEAQMWAVLYDDGMSLTTASERIARSLAEAERQRGRRVTVRRLDDAETHPRGVDKPACRPAERFARPEPVSEPKPTLAPEPAPAAEPEPPESLEPTHTPEQPEPLPASEPASEGRPPEPAPAPELTHVLGPTQAVGPTQTAEPASVPEPASEASPPDLTLDPEPARAATPARRRRLVLYALAAASIVVAAALAGHWGVLPRVGTSTSSSPTQVGGPPHRSQLLPPLDQPPVMHFSNAVSATSMPAALSGVQNPTARPAGSSASAEKPQSATAESASGGPSAIARGG